MNFWWTNKNDMMHSKFAFVYLVLILVISVGLISNANAATSAPSNNPTMSATSSSTSTTVPFIINGTTTMVYIPCTTTILPLWTNATNNVTTTIVWQSTSQCYSSLSSIGFYCLWPVYNAASGNLTLETGEGISTENWTNVYMEFVPEGTGIYDGVPNVLFNISHAAYIGVLHPGFGYEVTLPVSPPQTAPGTRMSGSIWMKYAVAGNITSQYVEVTKINITAIRVNATSISASPQSTSISVSSITSSTTPATTPIITNSSNKNSSGPITTFINSIIAFFKNLFKL